MVVQTTLRRTRAASLLGCVAIAGLLVAACSSDSKTGAGTTGSGASGSGGGAGVSGDPYTIVVIADESGPSSVTYGAAASGLQTLFDSVNDAGGVNGHRVEVTVVDSQSTVPAAGAAVQQAISAAPTVMVLAAGTRPMVAALPALDAAGIPSVSVYGQPDLLLPSPKPWFFAIGGTPFQAAEYEVNGAKDLLGGSLQGKRVALLGVNNPGVDAAIEMIRPLLKAEGASESTTERIEYGTPSAASQAANIVAANSDVVLTIGDEATGTVEVQALKIAGFTGPILGVESASSDKMLTNLKYPNYYGARFIATPQPGDELSTAAKKYGRESDIGGGGGYFSWGWVAGQTIAKALAACEGSCDRSAFIKAAESLGDTQNSLTFGPLKFSAERHFAYTNAQLFAWDDSQGKAIPKGAPVHVEAGAP
jgi:ABC-type branched-subunit amino acid transport system substrate-binding protein